MEHKISKAQLEVWEWKEQAWKAMEHLPTMKEKMAFIHEHTSALVAQIREAQKKNKIDFNNQ